MFRDPPAYWRRLLPMMATIPILFLAMVGASVILRHNELAVETAVAFIMPMPLLVCAYFGIRIQEMPAHWGYVLRGNVARNWGYVSLIAYFGGVALVFWFLST
jgi:hypothetical protein